MILMNLEDFNDLIRSEHSEKFARHKLFDEHCFVFNDPSILANGQYSEFRSKIADELNINPRNIAIVGSAKFGWSMAPAKYGQRYIHGASDIDIVIISKELFENFWYQIRQAYFNGYSQLRNSYRNDVFSKFIVIRDTSNVNSVYVRDLKRSLMSLNKIVNEFLMIENKASYRIYSDWCDAELYHPKGIMALQEVIVNAYP